MSEIDYTSWYIFPRILSFSDGYSDEFCSHECKRSLMPVKYISERHYLWPWRTYLISEALNWYIPNCEKPSCTSLEHKSFECSGIWQLGIIYKLYHHSRIWIQVCEFSIVTSWDHLSWLGAPPSAMTMESMITPMMTQTLMLDNQNSNSPKILIPK